MARLHSELVLGLNDQVSGPARRLNQNLENMRQQHLRNQQAFVDHRNAMFATAAVAAVAARAMMEPIQASTNYSTLLEDIRLTADATHGEIEALGKSYRQAGLDTAQGYEQIARANEAMIASGAVTKEQAEIMDDYAGRAATAYGADIVDIALTQTSIVAQLGVEAEETALVLDRLAKAGKLGAFELPDMSKEFAATAAQAAVLQMAGVDAAGSIAAWLQIARKGKSTGSEAATAMRGFMSALTMPNTQERFAKDDVDIIGEIARAAEAGVDPIEHVIGILNRLTGGDQSKLTAYFREEGALSFAIQATKRLEEYRAMMDEINAAQGTVQADFDDRMRTPGAVNARFWASMNELQLVIGNSIVPSLAKFQTEVTPMIDSFSEFVEANDELVAAMLQTAAALLGLRLMSSASGMLGAMLGMNGSGPAALGPAGSPNGKAKPSGGNMNGIAWLAPWIADQIGTQVFDAINGEGATAQSKAITEGAWDRTAARFAAMWGSSQYDTGLISPGTDGSPDAERMAALRADIARLEGAQLPVTPPELAFMKAELEELEAKALESGQAAGQNLTTGIGSQGPVMNAEMQRIMATLRATVESGIVIPLTLGSPNLGAISPPSGPRVGVLAPAPIQQNNTVGDVHVNVTNSNASPYQIGRKVGQDVIDRLNASRSNAGMVYS